MKMNFFSMAVGIAIVLCSCKKNTAEDQLAPGTGIATLKAKTWFEKEVNKPATSKKKEGHLDFSGDLPMWKASRYFPGDKTVIVPVEVNDNKTAASKFGKVLVLKEDNAGNISGGYYAYVLTTTTRPDIQPALFTGLASGNFSGAILNYSIDGDFLSAVHYKNGHKETNTDDRVTQRESTEDSSKDNPGQQNSVPENCTGGQIVCTEWYWQTFVDGILVYEEYLFTSCECQGGSGGGGSTTNCYADLDAFKGTPASQSMSETLVYQNSDTRVFTYPWVFYKSSTGALTYWGFSSYEQGTHRKDPATGVWKWESLVHQGITKFGIVIGGSVTCSLGSATPQVGVYNAGMELYYTINAAIICKGFPIGGEYNHHSKSPIWHVEYRPMSGD